MGYYSKRFWDDEVGVTPPVILNDGNTSAWWDFTDISKITFNGIYAQSVSDLSGNNRSLSQLTATKQPIWSVNGLLFDGVNDAMKTATFTLVQPEMIYIVYKEMSSSVQVVFDGFSSTTRMLINSNGTIYAGVNLVGLATVRDTFIIHRCLFNGLNSKVILNNETPTVGDTGAQNGNGFTLGSRYTGTDFFSKIEVKEVIIRKVADTTQNETDIYNYLKSKYGL